MYSTTNVLIRLGGRRAAADDGFLITVLMNAVVLGPWTLWLATQGVLPPLGVPGLVAFAAAGVATTFLGRWLLFASLSIVGPARSLPFKVTSPVFSILLAHLFLQERLSPGLLAGTAAVAGGLWLLSRDMVAKEQAMLREAMVVASGAPGGADGPQQPHPRDPPVREAGAYRKGAVLALLSGASFGTGHFLRKLGLHYIPSEYVGTAVGAVVALTGALGVRSLRHPRPNREVLPHLQRQPWEFWLGGVMTTLALWMQFSALRLAPVSTVAVVMATEPLITMAIAAGVLADERLTWRTLVSAGMVVGGVVAVIIA